MVLSSVNPESGGGTVVQPGSHDYRDIGTGMILRTSVVLAASANMAVSGRFWHRIDQALTIGENPQAVQ